MSDKKPETEALSPPAVPDAEPETDVSYGLTDTAIEEFSEALKSDYEEAIVSQLSEMGPADAAELLSKIGEEDRDKLLDRHVAALDPQTFPELDPALRKQILEDMHPVQVASLLSELDSDDALGLIINLDPEFQKQVIQKLSARMRLNLQEGLNFPEDSAGRLMQREFIAVPAFWTAGKTLDYLHAAASELPEDFFDIFVITPTYTVSGEIPLNRLVRAQRSAKIEDLILDKTHAIPATMDQEEVARIFQREYISSAPVVDDSDRLIGVITMDDVMHVVNKEAEEDLMKMAGLAQGDMYRAVLSTTGLRFRWLFVNLLTAMLASWVISFFGATIEQVVALAILMPIVASMGGNAGTQALTVAVRALATRDLSYTNAWRIIGKETVVGVFNGAAFALIMGIIAGLWFHNPLLGLVIAAAMIINLICAGFFGACIPVLLHRIGSDPAVSSAVFLTTVTDVVGFLAFLGLAAMFLV